MGGALAKAGTEAAVAALVDLAGWEKDPLVLETVIRAAGAHRDARVRAALEKRLDEGLPYRAAAAAYELLGAQRAEAPFDRLKKAAGVEGFGGHVQGGALRGLAATRRPEAVPVLLERSAPGASSARARPATAAALGEIGRNLERADRERVLERLVDLLRDPAERMRRAAVLGLETLGASEGVGPLQRHRASVSEQEASGIDRVIRALRREDAPRATALEKRVEELEEKLRKLDGSVQKMAARREKKAPTGAQKKQKGRRK